MFIAESILTNSKNEFCGLRLRNQDGVILDLGEKLSVRAFPLIDGTHSKATLKEIEKNINSGRIHSVPYTLYGINTVILSLKNGKKLDIVSVDDSLNGTYITIKSTAMSNFTLYYPLDNVNLFESSANTLNFADNLIRARIAPAFEIRRSLLFNIEKSGTIIYALIPKSEWDIEDIYSGCLELSKSYNFEVKYGEIPVTKHSSDKVVFLTFDSSLESVYNEFDFYNIDNYLTNGNNLFVEQSTGFFYNLGDLADNIKLASLPEGTSPKFFNYFSYIPIYRLLYRNDKIFYIVNGSTMFVDIDDEEEIHSAYPMVRNAVDTLEVINEIKTDDIKINCQASYRSLITCFRIPVNYSEIGVEFCELKKVIVDEILTAGWSTDDEFEVVNVAVETLDSEVWIYVVLKDIIN